MNKKFKLAIPFAVLALTCCIAAGCNVKDSGSASGSDSASGGGSSHVHTYTEWAHDDTQHWKVCPDDNAIDESSREDHLFIAGECDCGATEQSGPIEEAKYGTVTGKIKLNNRGSAVTDSAVLSGISVDMGDDKVEISGGVTDGVYTFTATHVKVGTTYDLMITCTRYTSYSTQILLEEENEEAVIGGANGITLEYEVFGLLAGYDGEYHDFSHVGENYIKFLEHEGTKTLNVLTKDSYNDVSASLKIKYGNSTNNMRTQGIVLRFENGKHVIVRYHNGDLPNGNIQYANSAWDPCKAEDTLFGSDANLNQYGEAEVHTLTSAETAAIKADGLDLNLILKDGTLYTFFDGKYVTEYQLPEGYAEKKVQVGYFAFDTANNAIFNYNITDEVPEKMESTLGITVNQPQGVTDCAVTAVPEKETYALGESVELSIATPAGYKLSAITVGGEDMYGAVKNGKLTIAANKINLSIEATFVAEEPIALDITVKGKKLGTTAALAQGTTVTFKNTNYTFEVDANGKISGESVPKGRYTVQVEGYFEKDIVFDEEVTEVVLEYDAFEIVKWDAGGHDLTHVNDEAYIEWKGPGLSLNAISKQCWLDEATISVTIKKSQSTNGEDQQGLILRFENGKAAILNINSNGTPRLQFRPNLHGTLQSVFEPDPGKDEKWVELNNVTQAELAKYATDDGITLKVARQGKYLYLFIDDTYHGTVELPETYASSKMGFGLYSFDVVTGARWYFNVSETLPDLAVTVTDQTAADAHGALEISQGVKLGGTVTITVKPDSGYMLDKLTVPGVTLTAGSNNTYTFVATEKTYTVSATFTEAPATQAESAVTGIGLNASSVDMNGKEITFKSAEGTETKFTVEDGKVTGVLAAGEYTVSCEGFYDLTATVEESGSFAEGTSLAFEKVLFVYNYINEPEYGPNRGFIGDDESKGKNVGDSSNAASTGKITAGDKGNTEKGIVYEWTTEQYKDVAITVTLKSGNGNQGLNMRFNNEQQDVRVRFENTKAQWIGAEWFWGTHAINKDRWDFGTGEDYAYPMSAALLAKYDGEGLTLTLVRKGGMVYALVDGKIYSAQIISGYATADVRLAVFVENATNGYEIPFEISTDVDAILNNAKDPHNVLSVLGKWTATDTTLAATGSSYAEFAPAEDQTKESLTINIAAKNSSHDNHTQGLIYRFENGRWLAARIEHKANGESYIQYSEDALLPSNGGFLKGWTLVHNLTDAEKTAFNGDGIELQMVRDGKCIYVMLGGNVIDKLVLGDEYATMDGVIAATIEGGTGTAYAYEYKMGENVTVPQVYKVEASFDGNANGYAIELNQNLVAKDGKVTLTVKTGERWESAWSMFPSKITVNGVETALTTADFVSDGANRLHYTKELTITGDTEIKITVEIGTVISKGVVVTVKDNVGGTATSDSGEDGYYWNDACTLYIMPEEGYEIASITIDGGEPITSDWTFNSDKNRYEYNIADPIHEAIAVVVEFRAVTPAA